MTVFGVVFGFACAGTGLAGETRTAAEALEMDEGEEAGEPLTGFTGEELRRLAELRAWLAERRQAREQGGAAYAASPELLTPLGRRYAGASPSREANRRTPILHIGRGPDGRIHHRYVFGDSDDAAPANPRPADAPDSRRYPAAGSAARIRLPELADQRIAPRLEYQLPDQRH